jgi:pimeloyl-ACP methyl ester carboxylesterase
MFKAVALLSVPYVPRQWSRHKPTDVLRRVFGGKPTYHVYFQEPGSAEGELEQDVRRTLLSMFYTLSGGVPPERRWKFVLEEGQRLLDTTTLPAQLPSWLSQGDLEEYENDFKHSGFTGGLNWYRNLDRNWELTASLTEARIRQPSMFAVGELDPILGLYRNYQMTIAKSMPDLRRSAVLKGVGHWITQEDPATLNRHLLDFLTTCGA